MSARLQGGATLGAGALSIAVVLAALASPSVAFAQPAGPTQRPQAKPGPTAEPKKEAPATSSTTSTTAGEASLQASADTNTFDRVFAEDWFSTARPTFEIHGYFRVRSELFAHFDLGRSDSPSSALWPRPITDTYTYPDPSSPTGSSTQSVVLCGDDPLNPEPCESFTQAGANMRLRVAPVLTVSDNIRAFAQLDFFDNIVLGSTPEGYVNEPAGKTAGGGYKVRQPGGYTPIGAFAATQWAPTDGQNSFTDSIRVKRAWGEYVSPVGTFRFGRMPNHWGLGMMYNAGDDIDQDFGSTVDRIMFKTGIPAWELYFAAMWDFADEGATGGPFYGCPPTLKDVAAPECTNDQSTAARFPLEGKRYDLMQSDDVSQWGIAIYRQRAPGLEKLDLAQGDVVVNGGFYGIYREQSLESFASLDDSSEEITDSLEWRGYQAFVPDWWAEMKWKKLRIALEAALVWGDIDNTVVRNGMNFDNPDVEGDKDDGWKLRQFGFVFESEWRALEDKLRIEFDAGFATGDSDVEGINGFGPGGASPEDAPLGALDAQLTRNRTYSTFRFNPDYQIDQILWRRIIGRVQSAYYFRPGVSYDFLRSADGQRGGGGLNLVWSRATEPVQAPGNDPDLGVELDVKLYYQGLGGSFDAEGRAKTGFYGQLDYAVLFPLDGLGYLPGQRDELGQEATSMSIAHMLRLYMGVLF